MDSECLSWRGHRVHVTAEGEGEPLLLVSGVGGNTEMWTAFAEQFPRRRIIRFDAPGTGQSSTPAYPVTISQLAALAAAILDRQGVSHADVIGYSYGGVVAQQLAYDHPDRVRRLVLAATHCGVGCVPGEMRAIFGVATPLRFYSSTYFERTVSTVFGGASGRDASIRSGLIAARRLHPPSVYGYAMQLAAVAGWSSRPFLAEIRQETLVISGDDDPLVPMGNAELLATAIPRASLEIVERAGHLLLFDDPEHLGRRIGRFLDAAC